MMHNEEQRQEAEAERDRAFMHAATRPAQADDAELQGLAAELDFDEWARIGRLRGWAGPPVCSTHDGVPSSAEEDDQFDEGGDPCMHVIRLYESPEVRDAVEANHSPSQWRKPPEERR